MICDPLWLSKQGAFGDLLDIETNPYIQLILQTFEAEVIRNEPSSPVLAQAHNSNHQLAASD